MGNGTPSVVEMERLLTFNAFEIDGIEKVGEHDVIDVKILPSRSSDCLCHRGIARELASLTATPLAFDPLTVKPEMPATEKVQITIADTAACRHFDVALVTGVTVGPSPQWLKERLEALGQRSINNIVDATNYVMFALGQPLHAYDADRFAQSADGVWKFGVRFAREGEQVTVLGGHTHDVDPTIQLVVNGSNDTPAGIAGVKGGAYAVVDGGTKNILIEAANFDPAITRKAAQKLRLQTDASKRFENGVASAIVPYALAETVKLVLELAQGTCEGYAHANSAHVANTPVRVRKAKAEAVLGTALDSDQVERIFSALGFAVKIVETGTWEVVAPFERTDISIEEDVIEEIGRIVGYDKIEAVLPTAQPLSELNARHYYSEVVRDTLAELGFSEVITSSFRKKDELQLANALASDKSCMRSALAPNIEETLAKNAPLTDLLGVTDTRVYEIGTVFSKVNGTVAEHVALAIGVRSKVSGYSPKDDAIITTAITMLEEALHVPLSVTVKQGIAEVNLTELIATLPHPTSYQPLPAAVVATYRPFSMFPAIARDIALWVSESTEVADVAMLINAHAGALRVRTTLFDTFTKDGRTSFAFRVVFQAPDRTLTDELVNEEMERVYIAARSQGWEIR